MHALIFFLAELTALVRTREGLREAIKSVDIVAVKKLLSQGVGSNYCDKQGFTLFHLAALFNQTDIALIFSWIVEQIFNVKMVKGKLLWIHAAVQNAAEDRRACAASHKGLGEGDGVWAFLLAANEPFGGWKFLLGVWGFSSGPRTVMYQCCDATGGYFRAPE